MEGVSVERRDFKKNKSRPWRLAYIKDVLGPVGLDTAEGLGGANRLVCKPGLHGGSPRQASHRVDLIDSCLRMKEKKEINRNVCYHVEWSTMLED